MRSLIKLPAHRDCQHLLTEGGKKTCDEVKEEIAVAQHGIRVRRRHQRRGVEGIGSNSEITHAWANYNRVGPNFKSAKGLKAKKYKSPELSW